MMKMHLLPWFTASILILLLPACVGSRVINSAAVNVSGNYCEPALRDSSRNDFLPLKNTDSLLAANRDLPDRIVLMANATGSLQLIRQLMVISEDTSAMGIIKRSEIRSRIHHRLLLATMEIAGIAAELDCEGEKADQLARYLDNFNSKRNTRLTVASIITGALTTIATVAIKEDGPQNAVAIGGGLLSAGLSVLTINAAGRKIQYLHPRNTLEDIWEMPANSSVYPPFTWYVLTEKHFSNSGKIPLVASIRDRWQKFDFDGTVCAKDAKLFFGAGGVYKADDLHTRAAMLNELQSTIRSVNQDLERLLHYIVNME